jgi:hypothetical protein
MRSCASSEEPRLPCRYQWQRERHTRRHRAKCRMTVIVNDLRRCALGGEPDRGIWVLLNDAGCSGPRSRSVVSCSPAQRRSLAGGALRSVSSRRASRSSAFPHARAPGR